LVVGAALPTADGDLLAAVATASAAMAVAIGTFSVLQTRAIEFVRARFDRDLMDQVMRHLLALPIAFYDRHPDGDVLRRFRAFDDVRVIFSTQGVSALLALASFVFATLLLFAVETSFALLALGALVAYAAVIHALFPGLRKAAAAERRARATEQNRLLELLSGIETLRMAGDRTAALHRWRPFFVSALEDGLRQDRMRSTALALLDAFSALLLGAALVVGGARGSDAISFVAGLGVLGTFLASLRALAAELLSAAPSAVDFDTVAETFAEAAEQKDSSPLPPGQLRGRIVLEGVSFRYEGSGALVIDDVSLDIAPGMKVALVGRSGSGKSTLGKLLLGLYLPTSGRILIDGKDLTSLDLRALRAQVGVVMQNPHLLAGSLRDNIGLGAPGATLADIMEAAERAALADDIAALPMGYQTLVSDGGLTFSGGQRQRTVIARALVSRPAVLLLDEATSALDNITQRAVEKHLARSTATRIVIAHRLSTIQDADLIVVVDRGRIIETGRHEDLVRDRGAYWELVKTQLGSVTPRPTAHVAPPRKMSPHDGDTDFGDLRT
jgi:ABC-type bacteriocin/lantibiotic exporter with double-glycine peptidase domain